MKSVWTVPTLQAQEEALTAQEVKRRRRQRGFTLIEMLAVVIILAIVAGVGFVVVNNQIETARNNTDIANIRTIADAAQRYMMEHPDATTINYPDDLVPEYLGTAPTDPWNHQAYSVVFGTGGTRTITITSPHTPVGGQANSQIIHY